MSGTKKQSGKRSEGPYSPDTAKALREDGVPLAFDPVQIGAVPTHVPDDIDTGAIPPKAGWPSIDQITSGSAVSLRAWTQADAPDFHTLLNDPDMWRYMPTPYPDPLTRDMANDLIDLSNDAAHHHVSAVIVGGQPVGQVRLEFLDNTTAEISYWIGKPYWGKGLAGQAVQACLETIPEAHPALTTLTAKVHRDNPASQRVVERIGLKKDRPDPQDPAWIWFSRQL